MTAWPGWSDQNTLILPLDEPPPERDEEIDGRTFEPKDELHITIVGQEIGDELRGRFGERLEAVTRPAFEALDWWFDWSGDRRMIEKQGRTDEGDRGTVASIVEMVELPALPYYYQWLGDLLGRQLAVPPPHVTLYTCGRSTGIGIPDRRKLRAWTVREMQAGSGPASQ